MSSGIKTVATEGIFAGVMHEFSVRFAVAGPWRMVSWLSNPRTVATCAICGQGIANVVRVSAKNRPNETIGFDCATTLFLNQGDKVEIERVKAAQTAHGRALRAARAEKKSLLRARRVGRAAAILMTESVAWRFKLQPHPTQHFADQGKTMFDYLGFCLRNEAVGACQLLEQLKEK